MKKFAFIGGGNFELTRMLVCDILTFPAFHDAEIVLMDINEERLDFNRRACEKFIKVGNYPAKIKVTTDRAEALRGADGVLCTITSHSVDVWRYDILIPKKYGVDINAGDTRTPSGFMRALRTIPVMLDICADIEKYCPDAIVLNYTEPISMITRAMQEKFPTLKLLGVCSSAYSTVSKLAKWVGAAVEDVTYTCAGLNHQAFFLELKHKGEDMYPALRQAMKKPEVFDAEIVTNNMFLHLGYYVTETSGHNSEYVAWYRKRADLIDQYCSDHKGANWNPGEYALVLHTHLVRKDSWRRYMNRWIDTPDYAVRLTRSESYSSYIFNAVFGDNTPFRFNGNTRNQGLIDNLPEGCGVEVPFVASKDSLEAIPVGAMPEHLAVMLNTSARCEELAVKAALEGDAQKFFWACAFDPLTSSVLSLDEIQKLANEMLEQNKDYLPWYK